MSLATIRQGLETVLLAVPGIKSASGWPTDSVGALPFAYAGFDQFPIESAAGLETELHAIPVFVFAANNSGANIRNRVKLSESLIDPLRATIRANQSLGAANVGSVLVTSIDGGIFRHSDDDYVGFIATLEIKHNVEVSYSGD